jgi:cyclohexadienyl dehydratase
VKICKYILISLAALCIALPNTVLAAEKPLIARILERGHILVGTTGDYKPFSYLNPETGEGESLGVEVGL